MPPAWPCIGVLSALFPLVLQHACTYSPSARVPQGITGILGALVRPPVLRSREGSVTAGPSLHPPVLKNHSSSQPPSPHARPMRDTDSLP